MKIIFICSKSITFNTFLKSQAEYFIKKGLEVSVACSDVNNLKIKNNLKYKINFPSDITKLFNLFKYFKIFIQINKLVKKNPNAIFYLNNPLASHLFRIFTIFKKLKIVYFVHGFRFTSQTNLFKSFYFKLIEKILSLNTGIIITINNEDYKYSRLNLFKKIPCYKIQGVGLKLTSNYINIKENKKSKIKKILVIAAYKREKGYSEIIKVAEILKNKNIKIDCFVY